ncbi:phosphatidylinositol N-acetylglucosaminyltransferase subunit gpi1 [Gonapodya sp. JEL0774]|nr:phosphatidylinositol N-acetylglucosaminyltransferase subunit gpi1 [Gonapodya sp. JEL0774]
MYSLALDSLPLDIALRSTRAQRGRSPSIGAGITVAAPIGPYGPSIDESKAKWKVRDTGDDLPTLLKKSSRKRWAYLQDYGVASISEQLGHRPSNSQLLLALAYMNSAGAIRSLLDSSPFLGLSRANFETHGIIMAAVERVRKAVSPGSTFLGLGSFLETLVETIRWLIIAYPLAFLAMILVGFLEGVLAILNVKLPAFLFSGVPLKAITSIGTQLDLRLHMIAFWPRQFYNFWIKSDMHTRASSPIGALRVFERRQALYIEFHNQIWLVANDVIIGWAVSSFIIMAADELAIILGENYQRFAVEEISQALHWLMGYPAGLKLNSPLTNFMGEMFLYILGLWASWFPYSAYLPDVLKLIGWTGVAGASLPLALLSDLITVSTSHIYGLYFVTTTLQTMFVSGVHSLLYVFRGKKVNVTRNRVDKHDYDLDQLLLGTMALTLLVFLFPTIWVYYVLAVSARLSVLAIQVVLEIALAFLNHFPLFAILLRVKEPDRLPGGLAFAITPGCDGRSYPSVFRSMSNASSLNSFQPPLFRPTTSESWETIQRTLGLVS